MDWKWSLLINLVVAYVGYLLGLRAKQPIIAVDFIKTTDEETRIRLNNIGDSPARDVQIQDAVLRLKLKPEGPFCKELNATQIVFKFDKIAYIEPHKPIESKIRAFIDGKEESESVRILYSNCLGDFKFLSVVFTDNLGLRCRCKLRDIKIEL
ncbi:MAG: hypothetical protein PHG40_01895 [Candidatus Omnitrophica bacterium]|nr:hypothetical protein [Candidatus Omnitrophota bacterium]